MGRTNRRPTIDLLVTLGIALGLAGASWCAAKPDLIGLWSDDALYWSAGISLATVGEARMTALPVALGQTKYPPGVELWVALAASLTRTQAAAYDLLVALQAALSALMLLVIATLMKRRTTLSWPHRAAFLLLIGATDTWLRLVASVMSEPLFTPLLVILVALAAADRAEETRRMSRIGQGLLAMVLPFVRAAAIPYLAGALAATALEGRRRQLATLAVGLVLGVSIAAWATPRLAGTPAAPDPPRGLLPYYEGYGYTSGYYAGPLRSGRVGLALDRLATVAYRNGRQGFRALAEVVLPVGSLDLRRQLVGDEAASSGARDISLWGLGFGLWLGGLLGLWRCGAGPAAGLVAAATCTGLAWPWPFAARFWVPLLPFLGLGLAYLVGVAPPLTRRAAASFILVAIAMHGVLLVERLTTSKPDRAAPTQQLHPQIAFEILLGRHLDGAPQPALIGSFGAARIGISRGVPAAWLLGLAEPRDAIDAQFDRRDRRPTSEVVRPIARRLAALRDRRGPGTSLWVVTDDLSQPFEREIVEGLRALGAIRPALLLSERHGIYDVPAHSPEERRNRLGSMP